MIDTHLLPINRTAAIVVSPGTHFTPKMKPNHHDDRDICPYLRSEWPTKDQFNLTGLKKDWLTVLGLPEEKNDVWVCRCVCGKYVFRTARSLRRKTTQIDKCTTCKKLDYIQWLSSSIKGK
jgi:hypothetical protein